MSELVALLTPKEAAPLLRVTAQCLAVWRCQGRPGLPYVRIGRMIRYRSEDIAACDFSFLNSISAMDSDAEQARKQTPCLHRLGLHR